MSRNQPRFAAGVDPEGGEAPRAGLVPGGPLDAVGLTAWVAGRVAPCKRVRAAGFAAEIPKSPSGEILRRLLPGRG